MKHSRMIAILSLVLVVGELVPASAVDAQLAQSVKRAPIERGVV